MSTRHLIMEAIDLSLHDAKVSDEMPQPGSDEPLGMPSIDISDEVAELGGLFERAGQYQTLMMEYPEHKILTASEEKLFNVAVNLSLAGTGLTCEDFKLAVKDHLGTHISQETLTGIAKSIVESITKAIQWIIAKLRAFWNWLFGEGGQSEKKKDEAILEAIKSTSDTDLETVAKAVEEIDRQPTIERVNVKDLGHGAVLEGDFVIIEEKKPGEEKGERKRIPIGQFRHYTWKDFDHIFATPPTEKEIDVTQLPAMMRPYLQNIAKLAPAVKELTNLNKLIGRLLKQTEFTTGLDAAAKQVENMGAVAAQWKAFRNHVQPFVEGGDAGGAHFIGSRSKPLLPDGSYFYTVSSVVTGNTSPFHETAPWFDAHLKDVNATAVEFSVGNPVGVPNSDYSLIYRGGVSAITSAFDGFVKDYTRSFEDITRAFDQVEMERVAKNAEEVARAVAGRTDSGSSNYYLQDLLYFQFLATRSQAAIFRLLGQTLKMIGQHRELYKVFLHLARKSKKRK